MNPKVTGIIAEYNPFHNGHQYHLEESRRLTHADFLIVVMSGDFVQRGAPALADKFTRAEMALSCGADLVLELPVPYATGSAEYFAEGAVSLLEQLGVTDALCFGSECGDPKLLSGAAQILSEEPPRFREVLQEQLKNGCSFPAAREKALEEICPETVQKGLLSLPNNILALEYFKALRKLHSAMEPVTIRRLGDYHETEVSGCFSSATAIRTVLKNGTAPAELSPFLPERVIPLLERALSIRPVSSLNDYSEIFHYLLLKTQSPEELTVFQDMTPELASRMFSLRNRFQDLESFALLVKTRQYTYSRIIRCITHILLNLLGTDTEFLRLNGWQRYIRVLGFRRESAALLTEIKKKSALPLVTKLADAPSVLPADAWAMLRRDLFASSLYHLADRPGQRNQSEFSRPLVIL